MKSCLFFVFLFFYAVFLVFLHISFTELQQENCKAQLDGGISRAEALFSSLDSDSKEGWKMETESAPLETKIYSKKEAEGKLFALQVMAMVLAFINSSKRFFSLFFCFCFYQDAFL